MEQLSERLQTPISTAELERRWAAVRAAMERDKIDVLLMQNNSDQMGGYVKYFTDLPATNGYPLTVVFPRDDLMTLVSQGPFGGVTELNGKSDGTRRGVKRWYTTPSYSSCYYTAPYDPELAAKALEPYAGGTIGLVGTYQMSFAMVDYMQKGRFSNSKFVDASDMVDRIKVIKSSEEQDLVKRAAAMQDGAMRAAFAAVEPGMRDRDIAAIAQCYSQRHGSEHGIYLCASMPPGKPAQFSRAPLPEPRHPGGRRGGAPGRGCRPRRHVYRARPHLRGRPASQEMKDEYAFALEARKFNLGLLKPGAAVQGRVRRLQRFHAQERPAGGEAPALPRPGLRSRRASAHSQRRADEDRKGHEHRRAPDLYPRRHADVVLRQLADRTERPGRTAASFPRRNHRARLNSK